jgi:aspartate-semialdehyde dehydrogenase
MHPTKLVVPEVNAEVLTAADKVIATLTALLFKWWWPCNRCKKYQIKRVVVPTYQSVTGTGVNR